jgi:ribosomal protein S24E
MKHLTVMSHVERTVSTGKVSLPTSKKQLAARKKTKLTAQHKAAIVRYEMLKKRVASPMGTKEEALAAAKLGQKLGMKQEAGALAQKSNTMRSAKQPIKDMAATVAAAENGNPKAKAQIADTLASADRGEPKGISAAGHVAAVQAVAAVDKGLPMPKPVAEATMLVERAHAGDPKAKAQIAKIGEAAQDPSHPNHAEAVELAVAATAASTVLAATAGKAAANAHWKAEARKATGKHVEPDEQGKLKEELDAKVVKLKAGESTYADGLRAREIAMALGMTALAAQISAIMPPADEGNPMSSLPEKPLAPITGWWSFVRESLKALTLSTPDPFENYREGTLSRGATPMLAPLRDAEAGGDRRKAIGADADQDGVVTPEVAMTKQEKRMNIVLKKMASGDKDATAAIMAVRKSALAGNAKAKGNYQLLLKVAKDTGFDMESNIPLQPAKV